MERPVVLPSIRRKGVTVSSGQVSQPQTKKTCDEVKTISLLERRYS